MKCTICGGEWEAPEGFEKVTKCIFCGDSTGLLDIPFIDDDDEDDFASSEQIEEQLEVIEEPEQVEKPEPESEPEPEAEESEASENSLQEETKYIASESEQTLPEIEPEINSEPELPLIEELPAIESGTEQIRIEAENNVAAEPDNETVEIDKEENFAVEEIASVETKPDVSNATIIKTASLPMFDGIAMILCRAGSFIAGSPESEVGRWNDEYQRKITITKDFYIGAFPITQAQYCAITEKPNPSIFINDDNPVDNIDWNEAREFCRILNNLTEGQRPEGYRYDLPTSAQWEYACRAGTKTALNSGENISNSEGISKELDDIAWYVGNSEDVIHPVGLKKPNAWGIYDMHGNIWEWCRDLAKSSVRIDETDPRGDINGEMHTCRGGNWNSEPRYCRSASRLACSNFDACTQLTGFRVVLQKY